MANVFEMLWDCPNCDTKGLLGKTHRYCPACGAPQNPDKRYFPEDDQRVAVENHTFDGVDKVCPACDTPNGAKAEFCMSCGSPIAAGEAVQLVAEGHSAKERTVVGAEEPPKPPSKAGRTALFVILGTFALIALCCGVWSLWTKDAGASVTAATWERTIDVERYETVSEDAWRDQVPMSARGVSCHEKQRSTNKVPDGQDCKSVNVDQGDGTFRTEQKCTTRYRDEPVMGSWCRFEIDKWHTASTEKATGATRDRQWPTVRVDGCQSLGCTREGPRAETLRLDLRLEDGTETFCNVEEPVWLAAETGETWHLSVHVLGGAIDCGTLHEEP